MGLLNGRVRPETPIVRGGFPHEDSLHYEPTLIEPRSNDSEVVQSEIFGPGPHLPDLR